MNLLLIVEVARTEDAFQKDSLGWLIVALYTVNIFVNMAIALSITLVQIRMRFMLWLLKMAKKTPEVLELQE